MLELGLYKSLNLLWNFKVTYNQIIELTVKQNFVVGRKKYFSIFFSIIVIIFIHLNVPYSAII